MKIAYGNSRMDKKWKNSDITWEDFSKKVSKTQRTTETVDEYRKMKKVDQDNIKDVGGFVGGHLKDGRRKKGNVIKRSMLTLDMDYSTTTIWDEISMFFPFACLIYSTHKHTKENPRLRLVIPLGRDISADEYSAVSRMVAKEIGIDYFDDTTYEPERLMYWPSTPKNGDFIFEKQDGSFLDPDKYLSLYDDWKDVTTWPVSSRQSEIINKSVKHQKDPLIKEGVVGAFCRTYSIDDVIEKFLSDIYEPSAIEGRYDYIPADSQAGVQVFDGKFSYSHHATDPACSKLLNAFDLVRVHRFSDIDEKESFKLMAAFAVSDEEVKKTIFSEREKEITEDFDEDDWMTLLELDKRGNVRETLDNLVCIFRHDKNLKSIAFNSHRDGIDAKGDLPWKQIKPGWNDTDNASLKVYLSSKYGVYTPTKTKDALQAVASERRYHPIKEYLESLPEWDGVKRIEDLFIDYFGAEDTIYTKAVSRKMMVAAVARIYKPGTKFDSVPILNGPQGIGKSTFFSKLSGRWFSDSLTLTDMKDKSGAEKLQGYWILELGELAGMRKTDVEVVKSFISREDDKYRAAYGVNVESHPRQCIIVGSTNAESGFLRDITGNRRFWPIRISGESKKKSWDITKEDVSQYWAEAIYLYKKGEKLYLSSEESKYAMNEQDIAMETDDREGIIREYLDKLLPKNWAELSIFERKNFLNGTEFGESIGSEVRMEVSNLEIWAECFGREPSALKPQDSYAIAAIMKKIEGWKREGYRTQPIYGRQRIYIRNKK
ncbi:MULTISPECIES: VapE domain-containing protein [Helcococcus]|uniref:Virulence-associated E family protein n=1 Tax=Helcococcus bovis TaxID=3153252 RepID=A0ABW9F5X6_9FIRM